MISAIKRALQEIRCGWHSGFALCCILWYILPWKLILKYMRKPVLGRGEWKLTHYHDWLDDYPPYGEMTGFSQYAGKSGRIEKYKKYTYEGWGMIPCPLHLWLGNRPKIYTCFCAGWAEEAKARFMAEHGEHSAESYNIWRLPSRPHTCRTPKSES